MEEYLEWLQEYLDENDELIREIKARIKIENENLNDAYEKKGSITELIKTVKERMAGNET